MTVFCCLSIKSLKCSVQTLFLFVFILCVQNVDCQTDSLSFPESWEGIYAGDLEIFNAKGKAQTLPMELHILPIDTSENHTFYIIYGEDKVEGLRPYELVTVDAEKGQYKVDEKNSIAMEGYLLGNGFYQSFEVMGTMLMTIVEKVNADELSWTIIAGKNEAVSISGGGVEDGEEISPVSAFPITTAQKAILRRVE